MVLFPQNITTVMLGPWCYFLTISLRPSNKYKTLELLKKKKKKETQRQDHGTQGQSRADQTPSPNKHT